MVSVPVSIPKQSASEHCICSVDATKDDGRKGRLFNHNKTNSNVATRLPEVDGQPRLCLIAARDIEQGEELLYDYGERSSKAIQAHAWLKN